MVAELRRLFGPVTDLDATRGFRVEIPGIELDTQEIIPAV